MRLLPFQINVCDIPPRNRAHELREKVLLTICRGRKLYIQYGTELLLSSVDYSTAIGKIYVSLLHEKRHYVLGIMKSLFRPTLVRL